MREPRSLLAAVALLVSALFGCGGGGSGGPGGTSGPTPARIQVTPEAVFLSGVGQTRVLTATVLDQAGLPVTVPVTWTSSAPAQIAVDASGKLSALAIGSAQVFAQAGGVRSPPVLVAAADPAPGAILVTDAQVVSVGDFIGAVPGEIPDLGTQYEVRVRGVTPVPAAGTIVLAAEMAHVAGRVVSTRSEGDVLVLVLELVPLNELVRNASISWDVDVGAVAGSSVPAASLGASEGPGAARLKTHGLAPLAESLPIEPFKPFGCDGGIDPNLFDVNKTITPGGTVNFLYGTSVREGQPDGTRIELKGTYTINALVKISFQPDLQGKVTCFVEELKPIKVFGWFSLVVTPAIRYGVELVLTADLKFASSELDLTGQAGVNFDQVVDCPAASECTVTTAWDPQVDFGAKWLANHDPAMRLVLDGYLNAYVALDAAFGLGAVGDVELLRAKLGPDQTSDLAFEDAQAKDEAYASSHKLKWKGGLIAAAGIAKIMKRTGATVGAAALGKLQVPYSSDISRSPAGTFSVDKQRVAVGQKVLVSLDLDAPTLNYWGIGYDVDTVEVWRKAPGADTYEPFREISLFPMPSAGQQHFEGEWIPTTNDVGTNTLAAFVQPKLLPELGLELAASTLKQVEVVCWPSQLSIGGSSTSAPRLLASASTCEDAWTGNGSSLIAGTVPIDAQVKWVVDSSQTVPGTGIVAYYPTGTVGVHSWVNAQGCTVSYSPSAYTLGRSDPSVPDPAGDGMLVVDFNQVPATYSGTGLTEWTSSMTTACPDGSGGTVAGMITGGLWFNGVGDVSADGLTIQGPYTSPYLLQTFDYVFSRP